jgi:hypothetical protein
MSLEMYRYFCLDDAGRFHSAEWFEAVNDQDAVTQLEAKHPESRREIWLRGRLVAKLSATHLPA